MLYKLLKPVGCFWLSCKSGGCFAANGRPWVVDLRCLLVVLRDILYQKWQMSHFDGSLLFAGVAV